MKTAIKYGILAAVIIGARIFGGWTRESLSSIFGVSTFTERKLIRDQLEREVESLRERESAHQKILSDYKQELVISAGENQQLTKELERSQEQLRREREINSTIDRLAESTEDEIRRALDAVGEADRGSREIERLVGEIEQELE